ncbi:unnamed protein product [Tuber melanosporum]|uniref:(Perigord truffle) hypothetical protein n=1 Tax=Tuber melanosporum (strain Mel28) TaxID=656061 RepID=D5GIB6_TUBMM|nr:uncharacterized protein GSTUM_00008401001 [Tuber melanosporum]CAZ84259.1 unnamed protein product [Tuber melanosporum]
MDTARTTATATATTTPLFTTPATSTASRLKRRSTVHTAIAANNVHVSPYPTSPRSSEPPCKPTSSLARKRRSSIMSRGSMSPGGSSGSGWIEVGGCENRGGGGDVDMAREGVEEGFSKISQAMNLLSLQPTPTPTPTTPSNFDAPVHWPSPEELLKESLRQSLSALHALSQIKYLVEKSPSSIDEQNGEAGGGGVSEVMGVYDRAMHEMRAAAEILAWAERHLSEEKEIVRERLLKG